MSPVDSLLLKGGAQLCRRLDEVEHAEAPFGREDVELMQP